jgi:N-acetyl-gamma-glutamyl-phosphate reductase
MPHSGTSAKLRAAVVGASGYSGEELLRLLSRHPGIEITAVTSRQFAGKPVAQVVPQVLGYSALAFEDLTPQGLLGRADVYFLALPHGVAAEYAVPLRQAGQKVIDLSADFRLRSADRYAEFYGKAHPAPALLKEAVYGLPETHREQITTADLIASPGCYPTSILLALIPALKAGWVDEKTIVINSLSGVSGAGKKAEIGLLYGEVNETMKAYGVPKHRHLSEIEQELSFVAGKEVTVGFTPHLVPLTRGMLTSISVQSTRNISEENLRELYQKAYAAEPFVRVLTGDALPEVRNVARTNDAEIAVRVDARTGRLLLFSAIDNLGKGAAGQAIQSMNLRFGFDETTGLV